MTGRINPACPARSAHGTDPSCICEPPPEPVDRESARRYDERRRLGRSGNGCAVKRPTRRKCRGCWRNFMPADLVTEALEHDALGYPIPLARWCLTCAEKRLVELLADPRCAEDATRLAQAMTRFATAETGAS